MNMRGAGPFPTPGHPMASSVHAAAIARWGGGPSTRSTYSGSGQPQRLGLIQEPYGTMPESTPSQVGSIPPGTSAVSAKILT